MGANGLAVLLLMIVALVREARACSCAPSHLQTTFCSADVVIRARIIERVQQDPTEGLVSYKVKQIKMFKGFEAMTEVENIYTAPMEFMCGFVPDADYQTKDYLLVGSVHSNNGIYMNLCQFSRPWGELTASQQEALLETYKSGCKCEVVPCGVLPCSVTASNQCLWTDSLMRRLKGPGYQERRMSCLMQSSGYCTWVNSNLEKLF